MPKERSYVIGKTEILDPNGIQLPSDYSAVQVSADMDFKRLKKSIEQYGQLADILVKEEAGKVFAVTGKRRLLAIQQLGLPGVRCTFVEGDTRLLSFIENNIRSKRTYMRLVDEMHDLKRNKQVSEESFSQMLGKSMTEISEMLITLELSDYVKEKIRDDERISFESLRYIIKKFDKNITRASALNDFISVLDNHVPSPSSRSKKRIKNIVTPQMKLMEKIETCMSEIILYLSNDSYKIESRAIVCRSYLKKLNSITAILREYKEIFPNVSIYKRESRAKGKYEIEESKRKSKLLKKSIKKAE